MFIYIDAVMVVSWIRTWFFGSVKFDFFKSQPAEGRIGKSGLCCGPRNSQRLKRTFHVFLCFGGVLTAVAKQAKLSF